MRTAIALLALGLALTGCKKDGGGKADDEAPAADEADGKPGATTAEAAALGFAKAAAAGDREGAARFLMTKAACAAAPDEKARARCPAFVERLHATLPEIVKELEGMKPTGARRVEEPGAPRGIIMVHLEVEGEKNPIPMMAVELDGRFFAAFPVKMEVEEKK